MNMLFLKATFWYSNVKIIVLFYIQMHMRQFGILQYRIFMQDYCFYALVIYIRFDNFVLTYIFLKKLSLTSMQNQCLNKIWYSPMGL